MEVAPLKVVDTLTSIMAKQGIKADNLPSADAMDLLTSHARRYYGGHSCQELVLAFDMAMNGQLDLDEKDVPCYQNFSCEYFSRIMNSYRRWAQLEYEQTSRTDIHELPIPQEEVTDEAMQMWLDEVSAKVRLERDYAPELLPEQLLYWLERTGKLPENLWKEERFKFIAAKRRRRWLNAEVERDPKVARNVYLRDRFERMVQNECFTGEEVEFILCLSRKMVLKAYILQSPLLTGEIEKA